MNRKPAVAGSFYPATKSELFSQLESLFSKATPKQKGDVAALLVPHAGYIFSGEVAASAFNQIDRERDYKRVFIIGSAHHNHFKGVSLYTDGNFETPYGLHKVDCELGKLLCSTHPTLFSDNPLHHNKEHGLEVQLPFINHVVKKGYQIVPIMVGEVDALQCAAIAEALQPWFNRENLFIISTDFSHYPAYEDAKKIDRKSMEAIASQSPLELMRVLAENEQAEIKELYTSLCGWSSVLILMNLTQNLWGYEYRPLKYKNSGDNTLYGEKNGVVGYWAAAVYDLEELILEIAKRGVERSFNENSIALELFNELGFREIPMVLQQASGVFVTLDIAGELRGCIGYTETQKPLYKEIANVARLSAFNDYRFNQVRPEEFPMLGYEVSVLSPMRLIEDISEIELGKHGIYLIKEGIGSGLFLPQVAIEAGWNLEQFLGHCARDKAGIGWDGWRDANIYIFSVHIFPREVHIP